MIKSEMGTVSMRGTVPVIISELAHAMKGIRESLTKEYGETAAEELISRAVDASKADGDPDEIMKGLINDTFDILSKERSNRDNTGDLPQALKEALRKAFEDLIMH